MELVKNFFRRKSYGFYVTLGVAVLTIITMAVYSAFTTDSRFRSRSRQKVPCF